MSPGKIECFLGSPASGWQKQTNTSELKRHKLLNITCLCDCWEGIKALGGNESVWDVGSVYNHPGPGWLARVHPTVTGSEVSGSRVFLKKICEAELKWSTSGRRTMRAFGLWNRGEIQRVREEWGDWRGSQGGRGEEELCVMSVFPCLSYFEMWLNGPPSVRQVPGLRAARSPPRKPETDGNCKCPACLNISIIFTLINLFKKCKTTWLAQT